MNGEKPQRLFVAVDPDPAVRERVRAAIARARPLAPRARWVDAGAVHVTLAFLGDVAEREIPAVIAAAGEAAARRGPMEVRFAGAGTFGGRRARVLWIGLGGEIAALGDAHRDLAEELEPFGYRPDRAELTPHLTLARAGDRAGEPALAACAEALAGEDFGATRIGEMVLYKSDLSSQGARYTALARLPFSGALSP